MEFLEGKRLMTQDGTFHSVTRWMKEKKIIVYFFTASWVNAPALVEKLKSIYAENIKRKIGIEIVYISSDTDQEKFLSHFREQHGPWTAVPPEDFLADELRWMYDITCLPQLVVIKKEGDIVTRRGKEELEKLGINVLVTWTDYVQ